MPRTDVHRFYKAALQKHGKTPEGLHWNSVLSQEIRFKILTQLLPNDLSKMTLVDAGCGFGDLYHHLTCKPLHYIGVELMEEMVREARLRTGCEIWHTNMLEDPLPEADYYVCSGAMNILSRFETRLFIKRSLQSARRGFVFNILMGEDTSVIYNYFQPHEMHAIAREEGVTCKIVIGYLERDMSVAMLHS